MQIALAENFRALFYAPFYACLQLGFFRRAGLDLRLKPSPAPGAGIADMVTGSTHVVWGGPLRVLKNRDTQPLTGQSLVAFGEVAARDPFFLVGRPSLKDVGLQSLPRLSLASVTEVDTPWLCLQHDLRKAGVDPASVQRLSGASMAENLQRLESGAVDLIQVFEPYVAMAEICGAGVPLHAAHARGLTAYTTFISTEENIARHEQAFRAMSAAIEAFSPWLAAEGVTELARVVQDFYPGLNSLLLERSLERYRAADLWSCRTAVSREGFDRLAQSMVSGGYIKSLTPYEQCVAHWAHEPVC